MGNGFFQSIPVAPTPIRSVSSANATLTTASDYTVIMNTGGTNRTCTIPAATGNSSKIFVIQKALADTSLASVAISDGTFSTTLHTLGETVMLQSDGTTYQILIRRIPSVWTAFTPTGAWVANTTYTGFWRRIGNNIEHQYKLAIGPGAPTAATLTLNVVGTLALDTAQIVETTAAQYPVGRLTVYDDSGSASLGGSVFYSNDTTFTCRSNNTGGATESFDVVNATAPITFANLDKVLVRVWPLPVSGWNS